jgi:hypothetical protein
LKILNTKDMKRIIAILGLGIFAASCTTSATREREAAMKAQQETIESMKMELAKQRIIDSMNQVAALNAKEEPAKVATTTVVRKSSPARRSTARPVRASSTQSYSGYSNPQPQPVYTQTQTQPVVYQETPAEQEKKGWSAKAKGAVIGGATGAAAGAIINKRNRAVGAVVGGVLGAGAGTGVGAVIDKKNGR